MYDQVGPQHTECAPLEHVPVSGGDALPYPEAWRDQITVDVIHDGAVLPPAYLVDARGRGLRERTWYRSFVHERDWGASLVAQRLA